MCSKINVSRMICFLCMFILVFSAVFIIGFSASHAAETFEIDPVHSSIVFKIDHLGVAPFYGRFNNPAGTFSVDENNPENNIAEVTVNVENVDTNNEERDAHLKNEDFFDAKQHPDIVFKTTSFKQIETDKYDVTGDLTFHGVTRPINISVHRTGAAKDPWGNFRMGFETSFTIRRSDFGMDKMLDLVGNEVSLIIAIEGIQQKSQP